MPFLKIFDTSEGAREVEIGQSDIILGRDKTVADVCLKDNSVSRRHAKLYYNGENYYVQDLLSTCGTLLNNKLVDMAVLKDGDNLQLGSTVIEFSLTDFFFLPDNQSNKNTIDFLMSSFRALPSGMKLRYRIIKINPDDIFSSGDTIVIGRGGLLVRECLPAAATEGILELDLIWPDKNSKSLLGEIVAVVERYKVTCIKLHSFPELKFAAIMDKAVRGSWQDITI